MGDNSVSSKECTTWLGNPPLPGPLVTVGLRKRVQVGRIAAVTKKIYSHLLTSCSTSICWYPINKTHKEKDKASLINWFAAAIKLMRHSISVSKD